MADTLSSAPPPASFFDWLVRYHAETNLAHCLPYISEGRMRLHGQPLPEGRENDLTSGCLILANGDTLADRLKRENIILDQRAPQFEPVRDYAQFQHVLSTYAHTDGAFVYDGKGERLARVAKLRNSSPRMEQVRGRIEDLIPTDFLVYGSEQLPEHVADALGTKTDLAIVLPMAYSTSTSLVHAYQIKRSAYTDLGLGKVTHFGPRGLMEEFFFKYEPSHEGPFIDPKHRIVGVKREYQFASGRVRRVSERVVGADSGVEETSAVYGKVG